MSTQTHSLLEQLGRGNRQSIMDWLATLPADAGLSAFQTLPMKDRSAYLVSLRDLVYRQPGNHAELVRALMDEVDPDLRLYRDFLGDITRINGQTDTWLSVCLARGFPFAVIGQLTGKDVDAEWVWFEAALKHPSAHLDVEQGNTVDWRGRSWRGALAEFCERILRSPFKPGHTPIDRVRNNPWFEPPRDILWAALFHELDQTGKQDLEKLMGELIPPASRYALDPPVKQGEWLRTWLSRRYGAEGLQATLLLKTLMPHRAPMAAVQEFLLEILAPTLQQQREDSAQRQHVG